MKRRDLVHFVLFVIGAVAATVVVIFGYQYGRPDVAHIGAGFILGLGFADAIAQAPMDIRREEREAARKLYEETPCPFCLRTPSECCHGRRKEKQP